MSAPTGLVLPPFSGGQMPFIASDVNSLGFSAGSYPATNRAFFMRFRVFAPVTLTQMVYGVGTASGNVDLGIYRSSNADGALASVTMTKVQTTGKTAASGSSTTQTINLAGIVVLVPGVDYYRAMLADNTTITVLRGSINAAAASIRNKYLQKDIGADTLPDTVSSLAAGTQSIFLEAI